MKNYIIRCAFFAFAVLFFITCSKSGSSYGSNTSSPSSSNSNKVSIANMTFAPSITTVAMGTTVTWTNNDNMVHTVTADDKSFNSGNLSNGATFSFTFSNAGTFSYHCSIHPGMTGSVVVK